jgi:hypothetical protein
MYNNSWRPGTQEPQDAQIKWHEHTSSCQDAMRHSMVSTILLVAGMQCAEGVRCDGCERSVCRRNDVMS